MTRNDMSDIKNVILKSAQLESLIYFMELHQETICPGEDFIYARHLRAICRKLEQVAEGKIRRLLIIMPPRHLKSSAASIAFVAWLLARDPSKKIICISYNEMLADDFAGKTRTVLSSKLYEQYFPGTILTNTSLNLQETTLGGYRMSTSVRGALTGYGADFIIIDDPQKALQTVNSEPERDLVETWLRSSVLSRLNNPSEGAVVVVMQRLHPDDLAGRLIEQGGWEVLELPAQAQEDMEIDIGGKHVWNFRRGESLFPERFSVEALNSIEKDIGRTNYYAQYLQQPTWSDTVTIDEAWFPRYEHDEIEGLYDRVIQSWDTALTSEETADYSVCTTWGVDGYNFYLLDVFRRRLDYRILYRKVIELQARYRAHTVIIERAGSGTMLLHELRREGYRWAAGCSPRFGKEERAHGQISKMEASRVFLPESAPWLDVFLNELRLFPRARNDDQIDSMVQMLEAWDWPAHRMRRGLRFVPPTYRRVRSQLVYVPFPNTGVNDMRDGRGKS